MFYIGEILKTRGNNGEVVLKASSDFFYMKKIHSIYLKSKKHNKNLIVESATNFGNDLIIKFADIDTITEAYKLIGYSAYLEDQKEARAFKKDNFVDYTVMDIDNNKWGIVINDVEEGLVHTLEVDDNGDIIFLPFSDDLVKEINKAKKIIIIDPPDGLRTLNK